MLPLKSPRGPEEDSGLLGRTIFIDSSMCKTYRACQNILR